MNEIEEYLNIVEQIKTSDKEKEALNFILNGFALCTDLLEKEQQENKQLKEQVAYMRRSIERKEEQIIDLQNERVPIVDEEKQELIKFLKEELDRLARECSPIYEDNLGKHRLVNEDIFNEVNKILSKIEKSDK